MIKDTVYVISGIQNTENRKNVSKQLSDLGFKYEFIYGIDYNFLKKIQDSSDIHQYKKCDSTEYNAKHFSCDLAHNNTLKLAYYNNLDRVVIMEDDILFHKDKSYIEKMFNSIPEDADIVKLGFGFCPYYLEHYDEIDKSDLFSINEYTSGTHCYVINNRKTMKAIINKCKSKIWVADSDEIFDTKKYRIYTAIIPVCIDNVVKIHYPHVYNYLNLDDYNTI